MEQTIKKERKPNEWVNFVKDYAAKNNMKYGEAIVKAKGEYKKPPVILTPVPSPVQTPVQTPLTPNPVKSQKKKK